MELGKSVNLYHVHHGFLREKIKLCMFRFDKKQQLVKGNFAKVYSGEMTLNGKTSAVAAKKINDSVKDNAKVVFEFTREASIHQKLDHRNIAKLLGIIYQENLTIVMEFCADGSLRNFLKKTRNELSNKICLGFAVDGSNAMDYLQEKQIVHGDITTGNFLIGNRLCLKLADFGLSTCGETKKKGFGQISWQWAAPELAEKKFYSFNSDAWSFGIVLWA
uniref:Protein kinase domain-containing protein n=1 Tax=Panagrolaimus sp. ES5 TaxID=591445 RepID=A0AC34G205_9BILA